MEEQIIILIASVVLSGLVSFIVASTKIGEYKNKVDTACKDIDNIKIEKVVIRDKVIACETALKEREPLTRRESPVNLTERGNKVLNDSGGKDFIDNNFSEFRDEIIEEQKSQTSYDIQESSFEFIRNIKNDERAKDLKEYIFSEGLEFESIVDVLGIYLRDLILKEKGIDVNDIDKYTPSA